MLRGQLAVRSYVLIYIVSSFFILCPNHLNRPFMTAYNMVQIDHDVVVYPIFK